jgi:hypothetical protein
MHLYPAHWLSYQTQCTQSAPSCLARPGHESKAQTPQVLSMLCQTSPVKTMTTCIVTPTRLHQTSHLHTRTQLPTSQSHESLLPTDHEIISPTFSHPLIPYFSSISLPPHMYGQQTMIRQVKRRLDTAVSIFLVM